MGENKDKYVYIKAKWVIIFVVMVVMISAIWYFRDRIETILLNNSNKSEYFSISSYININDGGLLYLDKYGKKLKYLIRI